MKTFLLVILSFASVVLALVLFMLPAILESDANRDRVQEFASEALGISTRIDGPLSVSWVRGLNLSLSNVQIGEEGQELLVAEDAAIRFAVFPLLVGKIQILSVDLHQPNITIVPGVLAKYRAEYLQSLEESIDVQDVAEISFSDARLQYIGTQAEEILLVMDCNLQMQQLHLNKGTVATLVQNLSFNAELSCGEFHFNSYSGSNLKLSARATDGVIRLDPITAQFFGGQGTGSVLVDVANGPSKYQVHYEVPELQLQGLLPTLAPELTAAGSLGLSLDLLLQGDEPAELMRSANGTLSLQGSDLTLTGIDLDEKFEQFELSQNFDLVDAGAFFLAGPMGLLVTKGYDFSSLLAQSGGRSDIASLNSDWQIVNGVAEAIDVAMATTRNRLALQGQLDLVNAQFVDMSIALIDREGCSLVQQNIHGSFTQPQADQSQILYTLAGPVLKILQQGVALFTGESCESLYSGKVLAPE